MGWFCAYLIVGSDLHHGGGIVGAVPGQTVRSADPGVAGIDVCGAVFTAQHSPLGEYRQTVQGGGTGRADDGIGQNAIVECDLNAVMVSVKGHRLYINVGIQKIRTANLCAGGSVENGLRAFCEEDPQILDAVLIPATVCDLSCVDGQRLLQLIWAAVYTALAMLRHMDTSQY